MGGMSKIVWRHLWTILKCIWKTWNLYFEYQWVIVAFETLQLTMLLALNNKSNTADNNNNNNNFIHRQYPKKSSWEFSNQYYFIFNQKRRTSKTLLHFQWKSN